MDRKKLKLLIEQMVKKELVSMSKSYMFKEELMKIVQNSLKSYANDITNQEDFEQTIDNELSKLQSDLDLTISMIGKALKAIPFEIFFKAMK